MGKIIILFAAVLIGVALVILFLWLIKSMVGEKRQATQHARNLENRLRRNPAAFLFWETLTDYIARIQQKPKTGGGADWELYHIRHTKVLGQLTRLRGYVEAASEATTDAGGFSRPDGREEDITRLRDAEHILPVAHDLLLGYHNALTFGADTAGGREYIDFVRDGLDKVDKILGDYIGHLFQNKSAALRAEFDVMMKWYGENKKGLEDFPRGN